MIPHAIVYATLHLYLYTVLAVGGTLLTVWGLWCWCAVRLSVRREVRCPHYSGASAWPVGAERRRTR